MSDSDDDDETQKPRKKLGGRPTKLCEVTNGEYLCEWCNKVFPSKNTAYKHVRSCKNKLRTKGRLMLNKCMWCGLEFKNRGNLVSHAIHMHGDSSYKSIQDVQQQLYNCYVCDKSYKTSTQLKYHIRSTHFNLQAKVPYAEIKKVNQIWFEKEQNTNKIMEIRKTGQNKLIMRSLAENTAIKINEVNTKVIDLSGVYPTKDSTRVNCSICEQSYLRKDLKKHFNERHLNLTKHSCNNCNRTFKRSYLYLQHHCTTTRRVKVKGVHHAKHNNEFNIASVESLQVPLG